MLRKTLFVTAVLFSLGPTPALTQESSSNDAVSLSEEDFIGTWNCLMAAQDLELRQTRKLGPNGDFTLSTYMHYLNAEANNDTRLSAIGAWHFKENGLEFKLQSITFSELFIFNQDMLGTPLEDVMREGLLNEIERGTVSAFSRDAFTLTLTSADSERSVNMQCERMVNG